MLIGLADVHVSADDVVIMFHDPGAYASLPAPRTAMLTPLRCAALDRVTDSEGTLPLGCCTPHSAC